ncbi:MAG: LysR substrate-binding domain-containing protein [Acidimicrobiia bacterium]|nr:LysR substrate-binding domain-containing protein [Acidimicrobiia bacterium]
MIQLRDVDLNLLVVLDALLRERGVTRAAEQLDLTPSAVSHALKRLRELFDDELLLRDGRRMRPTVRAESLAETLPRLLRQVARTIEPPEPFSPPTSSRTFRLAAPDFIAPLVPSLLRDIHAKAPGVRVELARYSSSALGDLAEGRYDALIATAAAHSDDLRAAPLGTWPWEVYARAGHPAFDDWSLTAWSTYPHLQVRTSVLEGRGPTDRRAAELGIHRVVQAVVPHFSMAAPVLAQTDLLLTVPSVAMGDTAAAYDLDHRELPFDLAPMGLSLFRNAAEGNEPGVRWFLERISAAFGDLKMKLTPPPGQALRNATAPVTTC